MVEDATGRPHEGRCYELAYQHVMYGNDYNMILVHANVWSIKLNKMIDHALVEHEGTFGIKFIYEPVTDKSFPKDWMYDFYKIEEVARYTPEQLMINVCRYETYGPWPGKPKYNKGMYKVRR